MTHIRTTQNNASLNLGLRLSFAMYICRACGAEVAYPQKYVRCPVCGIKWG